MVLLLFLSGGQTKVFGVSSETGRSGRGTDGRPTKLWGVAGQVWRRCGEVTAAAGLGGLSRVELAERLLFPLATFGTHISHRSNCLGVDPFWLEVRKKKKVDLIEVLT